MNRMDWRDWLLAVMCIALCLYGLRKSLSGFQRTRGLPSGKPYFYLLAMVPLLGIIALVVLVVLFESFGPFH